MIDATLKNANILIVDDQPANIDVLKGLLEMQGYNNIEALTDPREVFTTFSSFNPDLILLDLMMPYLNGFEVMERLKPLIPVGTYLPILVLTADVTTESKQKALAGGAVDFLTKPFDLVEVGLRIKNLLHSSYLQQQLQNQNQVLEVKVSERTRELEQKNIELNLAKDKAEASDRLKTSFINNISHEIRTPLNGILGIGQILSDPGITAEEKGEYLTMLNISSERLINTVTNFIDISLLKSGNQEVNKHDFQLESLLNGLFIQFEGICDSKNLEFKLDIPDSCQDLIVNTDKELVQKALFHLVGNAVKFTNEGNITLGCNNEAGELTLYVKDTGIGIAEESQKFIFKSFSQEDSAMTRGYEGSGLGLSIAAGLVNLLDGTLTVHSRKGEGSTFFVTLPCIRPDKIQGDSGVTKPATRSSGRYCILVAEDDEFNFLFISFILRHELVDIIHAVNGLQAVEFCKEHTEIDLVLMDLKMPVMDGFEATRQIKSLRNELPVIAVTAFAGTEDRKQALMAGCNEFITKPVKKELLYKNIANFGFDKF